MVLAQRNPVGGPYIIRVYVEATYPKMEIPNCHWSFSTHLNLDDLISKHVYQGSIHLHH